MGPETSCPLETPDIGQPRLLSWPRLCLWAGPAPSVALCPSASEACPKASAQKALSLPPRLGESDPKPGRAARSQSQFSLICHPGDRPFPLSVFYLSLFCLAFFIRILRESPAGENSPLPRKAITHHRRRSLCEWVITFRQGCE